MSSRRTSASYPPPRRCQQPIFPRVALPRDGCAWGHLFDKMVTPSDVGKLNCLVIPKQQAEKQGRAPQPSQKTARARCGSSGTCTGPAARATCSPRAGAASSRTRATVPATSSTSTASGVESELPCPRRQRRPWLGAREQGVHRAEQGDRRRGPHDVGPRPGPVSVDSGAVHLGPNE